MADRILSAQIGADISPAEKSLGTLAKLLNEITEASRAAVESRTKGISEEMVASVKALEHAKQALKNEISRNVSSDKEARQIYDGLLKAHNQYLRQREQAEKAFDAAEKTRNAQSLKDTQAEYAQREAAYQAYLNQEARLAKAAAQSEAQARRAQAKADAEYTKVWLAAEKSRNEESLRDAKAYWAEQDRLRAEWEDGLEQSARIAEASAGRTAQAVQQMASQVAREMEQMIGDAVSYVKEYDKLLTSISIVTGDPGQKEVLGEQFEQMAKDLRVESIEIAGGIEEIVRQGVTDMDQAEARASSMIQFSKIAGVEFKDAVEIITASANNLGRAGETTEQTVTRVADVFAYLGDATATGANEVGIAMQRVAGTAKSVGATLERTASQIAVISAQTREAPETIGRAMNSIYTRIQKVTQKGFLSAEEAEDGVAVGINDVAKALEQAGVVAYTAGGGFRDMDSILEELAQRWPALDSATRSYIATTMAGTMQMNRFLVMMDNYDDVMNLTNQAMNAAGTTAQKYGIWMQGVEAAGNGLTAAMQDLYSEILKASDLKGFYDAVTGIVNALTQLVKISGGAIPKVAALAAGFILLSRGFFAIQRASTTGSLVNGLINITKALFGVQTASIAAAGGMTALQVATGAIVVAGIVAGVSALVGWLTSMGNEAEKAAEKLQETREAIEGIDANIATAQGLAGQLEEIGEKSIYTTEELEKLQSIRQQIIDISPELAEKYNLEADALENQAEAARNTADALKEMELQERRKRTKTAREGLDAAKTIVDQSKVDSIFEQHLSNGRIETMLSGHDDFWKSNSYAEMSGHLNTQAGVNASSDLGNMKALLDKIQTDYAQAQVISQELEELGNKGVLTAAEMARQTELMAEMAEYEYLAGLDGGFDSFVANLELRISELEEAYDNAIRNIIDANTNYLSEQDMPLKDLFRDFLLEQDYAGMGGDEIDAYVQDFYENYANQIEDQLSALDSFAENLDTSTFDQAAYDMAVSLRQGLIDAMDKAGMDTSGVRTNVDDYIAQWEKEFLDGAIGEVLGGDMTGKIIDKMKGLQIDTLEMREKVQQALEQSFARDGQEGLDALINEILGANDQGEFIKTIDLKLEFQNVTEDDPANWDILKERLEEFQSMMELYSQVAGGEGLSDEQQISLMEQVDGMGLDPETHDQMMTMLNDESTAILAIGELLTMAKEKYEALAETMGVNIEQGDKFSQVLSAQNNDYAATAKAIRKLSDGFELTADEINEVMKEMPEMSDELLRYAKGGKDAAELTEDLNDALNAKRAREFAEGVSEAVDSMKDAEKGSYEYMDGLNALSEIFATGLGQDNSLQFVTDNLNNIQAAVNGDIDAFRRLQEAAFVNIVGTSSVDFSNVLNGLATVEAVGSEAADALVRMGLFHIEYVQLPQMFPVVVSPGMPPINVPYTAVQAVLKPNSNNPFAGVSRGGSSGGGGKGGGGGGGGGGKSKAKTDETKDVSKEIQDKLDKLKKQFEAMDYRLEINRAWQDFYEARGELTKTLPYMEQEIDLLRERQKLYAQNGKEMRDQAANMEEEIKDTEDLIAAYTTRRDKYKKNSKNWKEWNNRIKKLKDNLAQLEVDYDAVNEAAQEYTLEEIKAKTEIEEVTEAIKEQRNAIRQLQIDMKQTISDYLNDIKDRDREVLDATISMQDEIMEVLRRQAEKEFELNQEKLENKKAALEEELSAIRENFEEARKLAEEDTTETQLEEKRRQLSSMMTDPDKAKERAQLEQEIAELQQQLAWDVAEEEIAAREESLQNEIDSIDQEMESAQEAYDKLSEYSQEMIDQMNKIMAQSSEKVVEWLQQNSEDYAHATTEAQQQMTQDWQETMNTVNDIIETNWDEVEKLMSQGMDAVIEVLKDTTGFREVGRLQGQAMVDEFKDQWNEMVNAQKQPEQSELPDQSLGAKPEEVEEESGFKPNGKLEPGDEATIKSASGGEYLYTSYGNAKKKKTSGRNGFALADSDATVVKLSSDKNYVQISGEFYDPKTYVKKDMLGWLHKKFLKGYALGGIADFTGPAWLDGSPAKPERILSAAQTEAFDRLVFTLDKMWRAPVMDYELPADNGWNFEPGSVVIQVNGADGELDYEEIGEEVMKAIYEKYKVRR